MEWRPLGLWTPRRGGCSVSLLRLHRGGSADALCLRVSVTPMAVVLCSLVGTIPVKFSVYLDLIQLSFHSAITRSLPSGRIGVLVLKCVRRSKSDGAGVRESGSVAVTSGSSGKITFFLWTSTLTGVDMLSFCVYQLIDGSMNIYKVGGWNERIKEEAGV